MLLLVSSILLLMVLLQVMLIMRKLVVFQDFLLEKQRRKLQLDHMLIRKLMDMKISSLELQLIVQQTDQYINLDSQTIQLELLLKKLKQEEGKQRFLLMIHKYLLILQIIQYSLVLILLLIIDLLKQIHQLIHMILQKIQNQDIQLHLSLIHI